MRERLRIFLQLALFWLSFMLVGRLIFLAYNYDLSSSLTFKEMLLTFLHGLRMDASISGYFLAAYGLLLTLSALANRSWIGQTITWLTFLLLTLCSLLVAIDIELYRHWGFRMNTTPLMYIGSEAMGSVSSFVYLKVSLTFVLLFLTFRSLYRKKIQPGVLYLGDPSGGLKASAVMMLLTVIMFLPIRGSFTVAPMNTGFVYFHKTKAYANHSAVNVVWNFLYNVKKGSSADYPTDFFDSARTEELFTQLKGDPTTTVEITNAAEPNIILIILESFTADVIEPLGGEPGITPYLNELCKHGVLFTDFYSSGDRTDKGLISILSGYPAQPNGSIIKLPAKTEKLPQLNRYIKGLGYKTSFLYGGDIDFANFRSYLNSSGFDQITTLDDFDRDLYTSKWGVHDHHMFEKAKEQLDTTTEKFFKVILTLSSHEPFDVPMEPKFREGKDEESQFINSCHYTDRSLGEFLEYCKTMPWWNKTLVIITADHGHRYPRNKELIQKERFHIPLLMTGGAVVRDTVVHTIGSQTDIANTLMAQLSRPVPDFIFSRDMLNKTTSSFAAYFFTDGYGFIFPDSYVVYDNAGKRFLKSDATQRQLDLSKAYQQKLFTNYNNLDK